MKQIIKLIPKILATGVLWGAVLYMILFVAPMQVKDILVPGMYLPFVGLVTIAIWYSALLLTKSLKAASLFALIALVAIVTMILRYMNIIIAVSLAGMAIGLGLTFVKRS